MKYLLLLLIPCIAFAEYREGTMMLDEGYNLVPYQDYSKKADRFDERKAEPFGSFLITESEQRATAGVRFWMGKSFSKQIKEYHADLVRTGYNPDYSESVAEVESVSDSEYRNRTASEDILGILADTKPKGTVEAVSDKVTAKGALITILSAGASYFVYDQYIQRDRSSADEPKEGIRLKSGDVFISDAIAEGREISASLGESGSSSVSIGTFEPREETSEAE